MATTTLRHRTMPTSPPWSDPEQIEETNRKQGVSFDEDDSEFVRLDSQRFKRILRRMSELQLLATDALSEEGAREAFKDARRIAELLISDRLARRGWIRRTLGLLW